MTRINLSTYEGFLAFLKQKRQEQRDSLAQTEEEIRQVESQIVDLMSGIPPTKVRPETFAQYKNVADAAKAYLVSVNGAWRRAAAIAKALRDGGYVTHSKGFRSNIETALQRRSLSPVSPDKELVKGKRGWRFQPLTKAG